MGRLLTVGAAAVIRRTPSQTLGHHVSSACIQKAVALKCTPFLQFTIVIRPLSGMLQVSLSNYHLEVYSRA